jgi:hypothetical protein
VKTEIKVLPTAGGYKIKVKKPEAAALIFELSETELETFKIEVLRAWWVKHKNGKKSALNEEETAFNYSFNLPQNWLINKFK